MTRRGRWIAGPAAALLLLIGCAGGRQPLRDVGPGPHAALYRARFEPGDGERARKFRLLVHAAQPDRLHGEILSAVGTTELILDAGPGRVSIYFVRDRLAFVGGSDERALESLLGVPVSIEDFVAALHGETPQPAARTDVRWTPSEARRYPNELTMTAGNSRFDLRLKRLRPLRVDPDTLGTGEPPAGAEERPLSDLDPDAVPGVETEGEAAP